MLNLIFSVDKNGIIGYKNKLYITIDDDLKYFKKITTGVSDIRKLDNKQNIIVMGYNTWVSIPNSPLKNRKNIVITKNHISEINDLKDVDGYDSFDNFLMWYNKNRDNYNKIYTIGGKSLYDLVLNNYKHLINKVYITHINNKTNIDEQDDNLVKINTEFIKDYVLIDSIKKTCSGFIYDIGLDCEMCFMPKCKFNVYQNNPNKNEEEYLKIMSKILEKPMTKSRNGNVYSDFGIRMEFDLINKFPLITTKKMPWKTILRELLWFISGSTNNNNLVEKKVNIWNKNYESFKPKSKFTEEGDLGPIYGFQWRHFGADYNGSNCNYDNKGVDQLKYIIDEIKKNPNSRRLIMSSWNPIDIPNMALPPCHVLIQFYIEDSFIDAQLYQRSGDMFLGVPFNISSYSFLLYIIGNITGYTPRKLIHIIGNAHIYEEHVDSVRTQLSRDCYKFPSIILNDIKNIDDIQENNISIESYISHPTIKAPMIP